MLKKLISQGVNVLQIIYKKFNTISVNLLILLISSLFIISCSNNKPTYLRPGSHSKNVDSFAFYGEEITPNQEKDLLSENVIYFGYNQDDITHRYELVLLAHAKHMIENPKLKLRIDGHTDERGSAEYNIGLGERRAKAILRFIELKGIRNDRLVDVSYGKEKPAAIGHNEEAWRLNRRAELTYE